MHERTKKRWMNERRRDERTNTDGANERSRSWRGGSFVRWSCCNHTASATRDTLEATRRCMESEGTLVSLASLAPLHRERGFSRHHPHYNTQDPALRKLFIWVVNLSCFAPQLTTRVFSLCSRGCLSQMLWKHSRVAFSARFVAGLVPPKIWVAKFERAEVFPSFWRVGTFASDGKQESCLFALKGWGRFSWWVLRTVWFVRKAILFFFLNVGNESFSLGNRLKWSGYSWDIEAIVLIMRRRYIVLSLFALDVVPVAMWGYSLVWICQILFETKDISRSGVQIQCRGSWLKFVCRRVYVHRWGCLDSCLHRYCFVPSAANPGLLGFSGTLVWWIRWIVFISLGMSSPGSDNPIFLLNVKLVASSLLGILQVFDHVVNGLLFNSKSSAEILHLYYLCFLSVGFSSAEWRVEIL